MDRKLEIVFVLGHGSIALSGGFRIIAGYADRLAERGHQVTILAPGGAPIKPVTLLQEIRRRLSGYKEPPERPVRPFLNHPGVKIEIVKDKDTLCTEDFPSADILIATWWETAEWVDAAMGSCAKFHLIQDHEIFPFLPIERAHAVHRLPFQKIVVSRWLQDRMADYYDVDDAILIENAVEIERSDNVDRCLPKRPTIGFAYSAAERKNSACAIEACRKLKRRIPDLRIVAFGSQPPKRTDKMPGWVEYSLTPEENTIAEIYGACTVWLFTSDEEGFGLPILEAMARGTPVVATPAGAAPQIVTPKNGALIERNGVEITDAAERILRLSPGDWGKMSTDAMATARRRNWAQATDELEAAFLRASRSENRQNLLKTD